MCEIGARPGSHGRAVHEVHGMDSPANLPGIVKTAKIAGKSPGIVTQERHYLTALYARANGCIMSVELNFDIFKIGKHY